MVFQYLFSRNLKFRNLTKRLLSTNASPSNIFLVECLKDRALIRISGNEVDDYMQGLITNDMKHLIEGSPSMYTLFLNSRGRILFDTIIYKTKEPKTYVIECDSSALNSLRKHLLMYKVRRKISVDSLEDSHNIWVSYNNVSDQNSDYKNQINTVVELLKSSISDCIICCDPRVPNLGLRIITPKEMDLVDSMKKIPNFNAISSNKYRFLRYELGVGEGVTELPPGTCFPLESNGDYLHGVNFNKGCYIGQELTARTYHTGVVRKRLMPVRFNEETNFSETEIPVLINGVDRPIGKLRGVDGPVGIGLLRVEEALKASELIILGKMSKTSRPFWWPAVAEKDHEKVG